MANGDDGSIVVADADPTTTSGVNSLTIRVPTLQDVPVNTTSDRNSLLLPVSTPAPNQLSPSTSKPVTTYASAVGSTEGTGPNQMGSPAYGVGQFMPDTWRSFAKDNPTMFQGMTDDQILAKRSDPTYGNKAIEWYGQYNKPILESNGVEANGQNLRTAHALGGWGAIPVIKADADEPMTKYLSQKAQDQNPTWAKMTVGQFRDQYKNTPNPEFMGGPSGSTMLASTSTSPAASDLPAYQTLGKTSIQMSEPPKPMDMKEMVSKMALQALLPEGLAFHPVDVNPFKKAYETYKIPYGRNYEIGGLRQLAPTPNLQTEPGKAAYSPGTVPGFRSVAASRRPSE